MNFINKFKEEIKILTAKYIYPASGSDGEKEYVKHNLELFDDYDVKRISMRQSYTSVYLIGYERPFNSVFFDFYEDGREIDIFRDSRFNPYIINQKKVRK